MLKSLLEGEAEALLRHFQVTDANYAAAWKTLVDRFDNKRVLVNTQLRKLMSQSVAAENSDGIKHLLDTTMEAIHALKGLQVDLRNWDPILNYIVTQRLPPNTPLWEQNLSSTELPKFEALATFLEKRFRALELQNFDPSRCVTLLPVNVGCAIVLLTHSKNVLRFYNAHQSKEPTSLPSASYVRNALLTVTKQANALLIKVVSNAIGIITRYFIG